MKKMLDMTKKLPLKDRQQILWGHAEAIELARERGEPLPHEVSVWLERALKNMAIGEDANEVFDIVAGKQGTRRDGFRQELMKKIANGYIASAVESPEEGRKKLPVQDAINQIAGPLKKSQSTVRKNWNASSADRDPTFSMGKK